jgi:hypothetical protein
MLILTLKIGQRLYVSQSEGGRLVVEVVDVVRHDGNHVCVKLEIKTNLLKKSQKKQPLLTQKEASND